MPRKNTTNFTPQRDSVKDTAAGLRQATADRGQTKVSLGWVVAGVLIGGVVGGMLGWTAHVDAMVEARNNVITTSTIEKMEGKR